MGVAWAQQCSRELGPFLCETNIPEIIEDMGFEVTRWFPSPFLETPWQKRISSARKPGGSSHSKTPMATRQTKPDPIWRRSDGPMKEQSTELPVGSPVLEWGTQTKSELI